MESNKLQVRHATTPGSTPQFVSVTAFEIANKNNCPFDNHQLCQDCRWTKIGQLNEICPNDLEYNAHVDANREPQFLTILHSIAIECHQIFVDVTFPNYLRDITSLVHRDIRAIA